MQIRSLIAVSLLGVATLATRTPTALADGLPTAWTLVNASLVACGTCIQCSGGQHRNGIGDVVANPHSWCLGDGSFSCSDGHPPCNDTFATSAIEEESLSELIAAALEGSTEAATTLLTAFPERAELNLERGAVQVTSTCNPLTVVAHIPVSSATLAALATQVHTATNE